MIRKPIDLISTLIGRLLILIGIIAITFMIGQKSSKPTNSEIFGASPSASEAAST